MKFISSAQKQEVSRTLKQVVLTPKLSISALNTCHDVHKLSFVVLYEVMGHVYTSLLLYRSLVITQQLLSAYLLSNVKAAPFNTLNLNLVHALAVLT